MRVELQPAYVIHSRQYRDSSLIVDFITPEHGRVSVVVRGVRASSKSAKQKRSLVQPFSPLIISWGGRGELKTLFHIEAGPGLISLHGDRLFSALYLNELLSRLVKSEEDSVELYSLYQAALAELSSDQPLERVLRQFELKLLMLLGYGLSLGIEIDSGNEISIASYYQFIPGLGFKRYHGDIMHKDIFKGEDLLSLSVGDFNGASLASAKRLCRLALAYHLGGRPLKSRSLFSKP
ncbi:MAG: DNA repair protein RecO (recombination protein O) [Pseudohongiellaceae bacterium]|jgi:DNA repair protein RecO (recombination protein O)